MGHAGPYALKILDVSHARQEFQAGAADDDGKKKRTPADPTLGLLERPSGIREWALEGQIQWTE